MNDIDTLEVFTHIIWPMQKRFSAIMLTNWRCLEKDAMINQLINYPSNETTTFVVNIMVSVILQIRFLVNKESKIERFVYFLKIV